MENPSSASVAGNTGTGTAVVPASADLATPKPAQAAPRVQADPANPAPKPAGPVPAPVAKPVATQAIPAAKPAAAPAKPAPKPVAPVSAPVAKPVATQAIPAAKPTAAPAKPPMPVARPVPTKVVATPVAPLPKPVPAAGGPIIRPDTMLLPKMRARTKSMTLLSFFLLVIVPTISVGWYYFMVATPMYVSDTQLAFKKGDNVLSLGTGDFLSSLIGNAGTAVQDVLIVVAYIKSPEAMRAVDAALNLRTHYSNPNADFYSRLAEHPTQDEFYKYWKKMVYAKVDAESGLMNLSVRAYTPEMAKDVSLFLFGKCEDLVNELNDRFRKDMLQRAVMEVARSEQRVHDANLEMERFRAEHNVLDLESSAGIRLSVIRELEAEIAKTKADISAKQPFLAENHADMRTLRARLSALESQLGEEERKVASESENKKSIAAMSAEYERKATELAFSRKQHEFALTSLEQARLQGDNKTTYIVPVVAPVLPDEALYPKPLLYTALFFLANLVVYGFISMIYSSLKDHLSV